MLDEPDRADSPGADIGLSKYQRLDMLARAGSCGELVSALTTPTASNLSTRNCLLPLTLLLSLLTVFSIDINYRDGRGSKLEVSDLSHLL